MSKRHPSLPRLWLISDARNDAQLDRALRRLPRGAGLVFRHYHLDPAERAARAAGLMRLARLRGHAVVIAGTMAEARCMGGDGAYGNARRLTRGAAGLRLVTAHSLRELRLAAAARADIALLSPVYPTSSHPGGATLGAVRFRLLARQCRVPVAALGGMTSARARAMRPWGWAAIDGLSR